MENALLSFNYKIEHQQENNYLLFYNSKYYQIGRIIYEILLAGKSSQTIEELNQKLEGYNVTNSQLSETINTRIIPIFMKNQACNETEYSDVPFIENYWWTGELLNSNICRIISKPLGILFGKAFVPLFILLLICNLSFYSYIKYTSAPVSIGNNLIQLLSVYILLSIILLIHELGHISAFIKAGLNSQGVSFGFYLFMPILYVNLTDAWKLSKYARIKVNLAGITTQLIINLLFMIILYIFSNPTLCGIVHKLFLINSFIILINLIPFLKFDGYWIISDITNIPNLLKESGELVTRVFVKSSPFNKNPYKYFSISQKNILTIYSILRVLFIIGLICMIIMFLVYSFVKTFLFLKYLPYMEINQHSVIDITKQILTMAIVFIITRKYTISVYKFIKIKITK